MMDGIRKNIRLPRRRGDGPSELMTVTVAGAAPPQARGWTPDAAAAGPEGDGSPAGAGMDPSSRPGAEPVSRLPRRRGDGPDARRRCRSARTAPPQARGWTGPAVGHRFGQRGSPAGAGMDRSDVATGWTPKRLPRRRGDGPTAGTIDTSGWAAPPQARGWTLGGSPCQGSSPGSPAGAGMDLSTSGSRLTRARLPRRRGDGPLAHLRSCGGRMAPPQARGWTV